MLTSLAEVKQSNSDSAIWMSHVETSPDSLRQRLMAKLTQVPTQAARVSGPRNDSDISYALWQKVLKRMPSDFEQAEPLSAWRQKHQQNKSYDPEFMALSYCTDAEDQDNMVVQDQRVHNKNRYIDILAFEHSRVRLLARESYVAANYDPFVVGYINANFVDGPIDGAGNRKIIACQGPLDNTQQDVWRMIAQENVTLIVTTCNVVEKGRAKCAHFWPLDPEKRQSSPGAQAYHMQQQSLLAAVGISVEMTEPIVQLTEYLYVRKFRMTDSELGITSREIRQLHYTGWPDHGVPTDSSLQSFQRMLEIFLFMLLESNSDEKAIVHCSAGIGRTGTTIGLAHLLTQLWAQKNAGIADPQVSVFSTIRRLREQRYSLVQMPGQYEFIFDFLSGYLNFAGF